MRADYDLVIIGCGPAGEKAATQAAYYGKRVAIVERGRRPGGAMVNTGTIPSKALRETALLCSSFRRRPVPGLSLALERDLSISSFMAQSHLVQMEEHDRIELSFDRQGIEIIRGTARIADPHTVEVALPAGPSLLLSAEHVLVATGSSPLRPENIPFDDRRIVDADSVLRLERMPRSMAIVGGGVVGSEYACIFAEVGVEVTLIDPRNRIMPFIDDECIVVLMKAMQDAGVQFAFGRGVETATPREQDVQVRLVGGACIESDILVWAAGRRANTSGIGLEEVGIETDERGIIPVNDRFQTTVPSIWAAGDVIGPPALTSTSMEQGRVAACHMFGIDFKKRVADLFPLGIYTIPPVAMVGLSERDAHAQKREIIVGRAPYRLNARGRMYRENDGLLKLVFDAADRSLLGAAMVGEQATELIHLAQSVISAGDGMDYLINACFNYPSIAELYKYATYDALREASEATHNESAARQAA